jgi:DNA mismatch repair protein MutS2
LIEEVPVGTELDLHRCTVEEAIPKIDDFLHDMYRAGIIHARIVHGKGSGVLRQEVGRYLSNHPLVKHYSASDYYHGGIGATDVELK